MLEILSTPEAWISLATLAKPLAESINDGILEKNAESLEILAEVLHPDIFRFGYEGTGWVRHES